MGPVGLTEFEGVWVWEHAPWYGAVVGWEWDFIGEYGLEILLDVLEVVKIGGCVVSDGNFIPDIIQVLSMTARKDAGVKLDEGAPVVRVDKGGETRIGEVYAVVRGETDLY